ncbi:MAG: hypothetical protein K2X93_17055 [Candidatus Obscuribacterales bacterium]|nr:hypothetical protein [Candidatus Obscuribacterales bacterium]
MRLPRNPIAISCLFLTAVFSVSLSACTFDDDCISPFTGTYLGSKHGSLFNCLQLIQVEANIVNLRRAAQVTPPSRSVFIPEKPNNQPAEEAPAPQEQEPAPQQQEPAPAGPGGD